MLPHRDQGALTDPADIVCDAIGADHFSPLSAVDDCGLDDVARGYDVAPVPWGTRGALRRCTAICVT